MSSTVTDDGRTVTDEGPSDRPASVDRIAGAVIALVGLGLLAGGSALTFLFDRNRLADEVASRQIETSLLSDADAITVVTSAVEWAGYGLLVAGAAVVAGGIAYVAVRRRRDRRAAGSTARDDVATSAVLGAAAGAVLWILPFSPAVAGGVAGGVAKRQAAAGGLAGLLLRGPVLIVLSFGGVGAAVGGVTAGAGPLAVGVGLAALVAVVTAGATAVAFGALGGYVGGLAVD